MAVLLGAVCMNCIVSANAQSSLYGIIKDEKTTVPLEKISVELHSAIDSSQLTATATNSSGFFVLNEIDEGNYYILVKSVTYNTEIISDLNINNKSSVDVGIVMLREAIHALTTIIMSVKQNLFTHTTDGQVYKADQFLNAKGGTALDVLKNLPSISVDNLGEISLRGSDGIQVLVNSKQVQGDINVILNEIAADNIESIELITAPSAKFDANGKAGVINIITKQTNADGLFLTINGQQGLPSFHDYNNHVNPRRYGGDILVTYNKSKSNLTAAVNYLRNDAAGHREGNVNTTLNNVLTSFPSNGERSFKRYTYSARTAISYSPDKDDAFDVGLYAGKKIQARTANLLYNVTKTDLSDNSVIQQFTYFNSNLQTKQDNIYLGNFDYRHSFQNKSSITTSFLYEFDDLSANTKNLNQYYPETGDSLEYTYNPSSNPLRGLKASINYNYSINKIKFESGYEFTHNSQDGSFLYLTNILHSNEYVIDPAFTSDVLTNTQIHAAYTQLNGQAKSFQYAAGLRYEYSRRKLVFGKDTLAGNTLNLSNLFPSASILYTLKNKWKLKTDYSRRIQRAPNFQLNPFPEREHSETLEQGDPNLLPEFTSIAEFGIIKDFKGGSFFSTIYYRQTKNPVQRVNRVYNDSILYRIYTNAGKFKQWGLETGINATPVKWLQVYAGGNIYDYSISGSLFNDSVPVNNAQWVYSFNSNIGFIISPTLSFQLSANYISKQATAQGENSAFFLPSSSIKKTFLHGRLTAMLQWLNMDVGLHKSNRQRITTYENDFYTTTNYIVETDVVLLNIGFNLKQNDKKIKLPSSEFGDKEF